MRMDAVAMATPGARARRLLVIFVLIVDLLRFE